MSASTLGFERLFELERGLRSTIRSDQQKALDRFPAFLAESHGCPDVLEAGLLRLLDFSKARSMERKLDLAGWAEAALAPLDFATVSGDEVSRRLVAMWEVSDPLLRTVAVRWCTVLRTCVGRGPEIVYRLGQSLASPFPEESFAVIDAVLAHPEPALVATNLCGAILHRLDRLDRASPRYNPLLAMLGHVSHLEEMAAAAAYLVRGGQPPELTAELQARLALHMD